MTLPAGRAARRCSQRPTTHRTSGRGLHRRVEPTDQRALLLRAARVEAERADDLAERRLENVPFVEAVLVHRHAEMHRGHVSGRRGRELGGQRGDVQALDQWVIAMALEELQPECVQQDQDHPLAGVDTPLDLSWNVGEALDAHSRPFAALARGEFDTAMCTKSIGRQEIVAATCRSPRQATRRVTVCCEHCWSCPEGRVFASALGITRSDWRYLRNQILDALPDAEVRATRITPFGVGYEVVVMIDGLNGATQPVVTTWIIEGDRPPRPTSTWVDIP